MCDIHTPLRGITLTLSSLIFFDKGPPLKDGSRCFLLRVAPDEKWASLKGNDLPQKGSRCSLIRVNPY